jgi:hypothetical protein
MHITSLQYYYAHNKQASYKVMTMEIFATYDKAKPHRKYRRFKFGSGQAYDRSND